MTGIQGLWIDNFDSCSYYMIFIENKLIRLIYSVDHCGVYDYEVCDYRILDHSCDHFWRDTTLKEGDYYLQIIDNYFDDEGDYPCYEILALRPEEELIIRTSINGAIWAFRRLGVPNLFPDYEDGDFKIMR
jgi:hypothetical protein